MFDCESRAHLQVCAHGRNMWFSKGDQSTKRAQLILCRHDDKFLSGGMRIRTPTSFRRTAAAKTTLVDSNKMCILSITLSVVISLCHCQCAGRVAHITTHRQCIISPPTTVLHSAISTVIRRCGRNVYATIPMTTNVAQLQHHPHIHQRW